jgi:phosphate-selective porin
VNGNTGNNARTNARGFNSFSLGFNWYLNPNIRASANAVYTQWYYSANGGTSGVGVPSNNSNITNNEFGITTRLQLFF